MKKIYLVLAIGATMFSYSCNSGTTSEKDLKDSSQKSETAAERDTSTKTQQEAATIESDFATKATIGGTMEVESSARMIKATENPDIQTLATMMVKDHSAANRELTTLAKKLKIKLPTVLPKEKTDILAQMQPMKEDQKNLFYADLMVKEHNDAVALFETASKNENGELQTFAAKHLPTLKMHRVHAIAIQKIMHSIDSDKGDRPLKTSKDRQ